MTGLEVGDFVQCRHCREWHEVTAGAPREPQTASERAMLYVYCPHKRGTFYVGTIGTVPRWPMRRSTDV